MIISYKCTKEHLYKIRDYFVIYMQVIKKIRVIYLIFYKTIFNVKIVIKSCFFFLVQLI